MLPGLVIAALAGVPLILGAAGGVLVAAGGIALVARDARAGGDVGVAVVVSGLFGLGGILALSPETPPRLGELLFGDLLGHHERRPRRGRGALAPACWSRWPSRYRALAARRSPAAARRRSASGPRAPTSRCSRCSRVTTVAAVQGLGQPAARRARPRARPPPRSTSPSGCPRVLALAAGLAALAGVAGLVVSYELEIAAGA